MIKGSPNLLIVGPGRGVGSSYNAIGGIWRYFSTSRQKIGRPKDGWTGLWLSPCLHSHLVIHSLFFAGPFKYCLHILHQVTRFEQWNLGWNKFLEPQHTIWQCGLSWIVQMALHAMQAHPIEKIVQALISFLFDITGSDYLCILFCNIVICTLQSQAPLALSCCHAKLAWFFTLSGMFSSLHRCCIWLSSDITSVSPAVCKL